MVLMSCSGGGGGGGNGSCDVNISGMWSMTETVTVNQCNPIDLTTEQHVYTVVQNGCGFTATADDGRTYSGTVSGKNVSWSGSNPSDSGSGIITVTGTSITAASDGNSMSGSGNWTWSDGPGGYNDCSGTTNISGARAQSTGPATVDASGAWSGNWHSTIPAHAGLNGTFAGVVSQSGTTLTGTIAVSSAYINLSNQPLKGSVHGSTVTFGDINNIIIFTGTMTGNMASGTYTYDDSINTDTGTWSGVRTAPTQTATPLTITDASPSGGAQNVSIYSAVTVTFSEPILPPSIDNSTFMVSDNSGTIAGTVTTPGDDRTAVFMPASSLTASTVYTVTIGAGVLNANGSQSLASDYTWTFTTGAGSAGTTYISTDVTKSIPDGDMNTGATSTVLVSGGTNTISHVAVTLTITHTYDADLRVYLVSAAGTTVALSTGNGLNGDNYTNTVFDDSATIAIVNGSPPYAGAFKPEGALSALIGQNANGTWKLRVFDDFSADVGRIESWSITIW